MSSRYIVVFFALSIQLVKSANILIIPAPFSSHVNTQSIAGQALLDNGHHVTVLAPDHLVGMATRRGLQVLVYSGHYFVDNAAWFEEHQAPLLAEGKSQEAISQSMKRINPSLTQQCVDFLSNSTLLEKIKIKKFDLVLVEGGFMFKCAVVIPYKFGIAFILSVVLPQPWSAGVTTMPSFEPSFFTISLTSEMTFFQRIINLIFYILLTFGDSLPISSNYKFEEHLSVYVPERPKITLDEIIQQAEMWLIHMDIWCLDYPRLSAPHYQYIGGTTVTAPNPLSKELEDFMSQAEHGVILLSFGSEQAFRKALMFHIHKFIEAFSHVKQRVLLNLEKMENIPDNIKCMPWVPQNDVLAHPKTSLFISHGGANGQMEAVAHGVPMISFGLLYDQHYNARRIQHHVYGRALELHAFTSQELVESINDITRGDSIYKNNTKRCSRIIKQFPSPNKSIQFWVNHILRFGGSHLKSKSINMPFYKLFMLDVLFLIGCTLIFIAVLLYAMCLCIVKRSKKCIVRKGKIE